MRNVDGDGAEDGDLASSLGGRLSRNLSRGLGRSAALEDGRTLQRVAGRAGDAAPTSAASLIAGAPLSLRALERDGGGRTPAGLQRRATLTQRRLLLGALCGVSTAALAVAMARLLGAGGWTTLEASLFACVLLSAIWMIFGFWTSVIGLVLKRLWTDADQVAAPHWRDVDAAEPIVGATAILMTLRNEDPARAFQRLLALRRSLDQTPDAAAFDVYVLSDTNIPEIAAEEERLMALHQRALDGAGLATYRRRAVNTGYKAGNLRDWLDRWGDAYAFMVPLDADSLMSGDAVCRIVRVIQRHPRLGLIQCLALGAPSDSPFARLFQFGSRLGQRIFALGAAWWQGDCGPFWGHNAVIRVAPFKRYCKLPVLNGAPPLGGPVLSHDQLEAALLRRGGYEVRLAPVETESFEDMPVTLLDFLKRDARWANGNMQYFQLLGLSRLRRASRFQLLQAIMIYVAQAAWMGMMALAALQIFFGGQVAGLSASDGAGTAAVDADFDASLAVAIFAVMMTVTLAPKILGALDIALEPGGVARYGGPVRFFGGLAAELVFSVLMAPVAAFATTVFLLGLPFGKKLDWGGQVRDAYGLRWGTALQALWMQTAAGAALSVGVLMFAPHVAPWAAPVLLGLVLAAPFAVVTASPALGAAMRRSRFAAVPEDVRPPAILTAAEAIDLNRNVAAAATRGPGAVAAE